jgi:hypothetical protein
MEDSLLIKFQGATVVSFDFSLGWNENASSVTITLVEDTPNGDEIEIAGTGNVLKFTYGKFKFEGLVEFFNRREDMRGLPSYEVRLTSPNELLDGVQVILTTFNGETGLIPNLMNAYGLYENTFGFGGSLVNDSGMVWQADYKVVHFDVVVTGSGGGTLTTDNLGAVGIKPAIESLTAGAGGGYGGPVKFKGSSFSVDLSGLPTCPADYRLGGDARSILSLVSEFCQDAGHDYICYFEDGVIKFKSVSRLVQPDAGVLANWIKSQPDAESRSIGAELRNEPTNAVMLGGDVQDLIQIYNYSGDTTIWPFWGFDPNTGVPIKGTGKPEVWHEAVVPADSIADIIGDTIYHLTVPELRTALANFESWAAYLMRWYPEKATLIGLVNTVDSKSDLQAIFPDVLFRRDLIAQDDESGFFFGRMNEVDYWTQRANRVFEFVQMYAREYFGKKFLVRIPFWISWKFVPETYQVVSSDEIADGGYIPEGAMPLGLPYSEIDKFMSDTGLFECFVAFPYTPFVDINRLSPENAAIVNDTLYIKASVDRQIVYLPGEVYPYCVVTLSDPVYEVMPDPLGGVEDIAAMLNVSKAHIVQATGIRHGSFPVRLEPAPFRPVAAAIPIKSNRRCYGPWGTFGEWGTTGVPGKVLWERDQSLTPWDCGDWETMNRMASSKLTNAASNQQESATGSVTLPGMPLVSMGDALVEGGPLVTSISLSYSSEGIKTSYQMRTYSPVFGAFSRSNYERLKRLGIAGQQVRRAVRALFNKSRERQQVVSRAMFGRVNNIAHAVRQQTPHDALLSTMSWSDGLGQYRTQASTMTVDELFANQRSDNPDIHQATAGMGMEGLIRPFNTSYYGEVAGDMPHFEKSPPVIYKNALTTEAVDPIRGSDIDILVNGNTASVHTIKTPPDLDNIRAIGLRGPLVLVGWGAEVTGKPIPNRGDESLPLHQWDDNFSDQPAKHPEDWRAGIVGLHWDNWRKLWTIPTNLRGKLDEDLSDTTGTKWVYMTITVLGEELPDKVKVFNDWGGNLRKGQKVKAEYYPLENRWYITGASCSK